ncbi:hypothetical protein [Pseudomonas yamanorum]|uniref:hypothetical protein n=1 Tax=Pseudomonas yamanorum TaxID=515393 RepID=UPI003F74D3BA
MLIETALVANDDTIRESISINFPDDEWAQLAQFHSHVNGLRETRFVQEGRGGSIGFRWKLGEPARVSEKQIEEEPVWAMLHKLRPFVLQKERCFLPSILKLLKRRLDHVALHRHLDDIRDTFTLKSMEQRIHLLGPGRPPLSQQVVMDWLNSFQYHHDEEKRVKVIRDLGPFAQYQDGMNVAVFALVDMVQSILGAGDLVETLQGCIEGAITEVRCPPSYFVQKL